MMATSTASRRLAFPLLAVLFAWCAVSPVAAQDGGGRAGSDLDYLELTARLIGDGYYDRAERALRNVDPQDEAADPARYYTLGGLVHLRRGRSGPAAESFQAALAAHDAVPETERDAGQEDARKLVALYLGQAQFERAHYAEALEALNAAGERADVIAAVQALRAQAHWELGNRVAAIASLNTGTARFPDDQQFLRRKVFYLIDMGFHQRAAELGKRYLSQAQASPEDYLAIGRALRRSGQLDEALRILERGRLGFPGASVLGVELAHAYVDHGQTRTGADLLSAVAMRDRQYRLQAAELQRRAGRLQRALMLNADVMDQAAKLRQRLSLLVDTERWSEAAAMGDALRRNGLLESDDLRYAWAYSLFKDGNYDAADSALGGIAAGDSFRKATELRRIMEQCREARWKCL